MRNAVTTICADCGNACPADDCTEVRDGVFVCRDCLELSEDYCQCDDCGAWVPRDATEVVYHGDEERHVCGACYELYIWCWYCGKYCSDDSLSRDEFGHYICENCKQLEDAEDAELNDAVDSETEVLS